MRSNSDFMILNALYYVMFIFQIMFKLSTIFHRHAFHYMWIQFHIIIFFPICFEFSSVATIFEGKFDSQLLHSRRYFQHDENTSTPASKSEGPSFSPVLFHQTRLFFPRICFFLFYISSPPTFLSPFLLAVSGKKCQPLSRLYSSPRRSPWPPRPSCPRGQTSHSSTRVFCIFQRAFFPLSTLSLSLSLSLAGRHRDGGRAGSCFQGWQVVPRFSWPHECSPFLFSSLPVSFFFIIFFFFFFFSCLSSHSSVVDAFSPGSSFRFVSLPGQRNARLSKSNFALFPALDIFRSLLARGVFISFDCPLCGLLDPGRKTLELSSLLIWLTARHEETPRC